MTVRLVVVNDLHIGSTVGLCPPSVELDDGGSYLPSKSQRWLWRNWKSLWAEVAALKGDGGRVIALIDGDAVDRNKHSVYQTLNVNRAGLLRAAVDALQPMLDVTDSVIIVRGTEAHTGGNAELEEELANDIEAIRDEQAGTASWWYWEASIEGINILASHHPGTNSARPWTKGGGANRAAAITMDAYYSERWRPNLALFAHVHHNEDSFDNFPLRAVFCRPFSLASAYDHRSGRGWQTSRVGGLVITIEDGAYDINKPNYSLPRRTPWKMTTN